jgi:acyl-CoA thioesterase
MDDMDQKVREAIFKAAASEPFPQRLGIRLVELDDGYSLVEMVYDPASMDNLYQMAHGGAVFALIDEAFETAGQTDGTMALALNVSVTYISSPEPGSLLRAEARENSRTKKTINFDIKVKDEAGRMLAACQALAYRTGKPIPWL